MAEIHTAAVERGQGLLTILTQIARSELSIFTQQRSPHHITTVGSAGSTSASRQTMMAGGAVQMACKAAVKELSRRAGGPIDPHVDQLDDLLGQPIEQTEVYHHRRTTGFDQAGQGDIHVSLVFGAECAVVEVDTELGLVRVVQVDAVQDAGRAINPGGVAGQVEGGTAFGLGLAAMEEVQLDEGRIANASFTDYLIPTILAGVSDDHDLVTAGQGLG